MPLKLNSSGGGSVTLDVPATATATNLVVPAANGTVVVADNSGNVTYSGATTFSGNATFNAGLIPSSSFLRNRIINGDMRIDQRNAGASRSCSAGSITYVTDRWFLFPAGAGLTAQQVAGTNTSTSRALRISGATGSTGCNVEQRIEDLNIQDLAGQTVTFRARVWCSSAISNATVYAISPTVANNYGFITTSFDTAITLNAGLNIVTVTGVLNSGATLGQAVGFAFKSGIGNGVTVEISEVQLEVGSVATPFERRQFGQELALCQRYAWVSLLRIAASGAMQSMNTTLVETIFPTTMRASPTVNVSPSTITVDDYFSTTTTGSLAGFFATTEGAAFLISGIATLSPPRPMHITSSNNAVFTLSAEL